MRRSLLTIALVALACGTTVARSLSPSEALSRALDSGNRNGALRAPVRAIPLLTVGTEEQPAVYVFDQGTQGYLIVSADDVAAPVLAYSDSGTFDPYNISESLRWWLGEYKTQIEAASKARAESYEKASRAERKPIEPLIKTLWNQGEPFNNDCPLLNGERTVTGCVATAMAQVMNYHKWPESFNADFNYKWKFNNTDLSWYQVGVKLDWDNMISSYTGEYKPIEGNSVATLMKACGYSVEMNYNLENTIGSTASSTYIPKALIEHFNYDSNVYSADRSYYSLSEWEDLIYNELLNERPVIYSGNNDFSGHCFVCDGYQSDGYYHFNWGWSGASDGYFLLTALDPDMQGIGGSTSGYTANQNAILGIGKPGSVTETPQFICNGTLSASWNGNILKIEALTPYGQGLFFNMTQRNITGRFGMQFVDENGKIAKTVLWRYTSSTVGPNSGYTTIECNGKDLPKGEYKLYPIFQTDKGNTIRIKVAADQPDYIDYDRKGNNITVTTPEFGKYSVTDLKLETPMYQNSRFLVTGKAVWTGPNSVNTPVYGVLMTGTTAETIIALGETMPQEFLPDGTPAKFNYLSKWIKFTREYQTGVPSGDYYFAMAIAWGGGYKLLSSPISMTMQALPGNLEMQESNLVIPDQNDVDPDNFNISFDATCLNGYFFDSYVVVLFPYIPYTVVEECARFNTETTLINIGETKTLSAKGIIPNTKPGEKYEVCVYKKVGSNLEKTSLEGIITIGDKSGISDVIADGNVMAKAYPNPAVDYSVIIASDEILRVDLISLSGTSRPVPADINGQSARIDVSAIPTGLYIVRVSTASGVETVKIVKM